MRSPTIITQYSVLLITASAMRVMTPFTELMSTFGTLDPQDRLHEAHSLTCIGISAGSFVDGISQPFPDGWFFNFHNSGFFVLINLSNLFTLLDNFFTLLDRGVILIAEFFLLLLEILFLNDNVFLRFQIVSGGTFLPDGFVCLFTVPGVG